MNNISNYNNIFMIIKDLIKDINNINTNKIKILFNIYMDNYQITIIFDTSDKSKNINYHIQHEISSDEIIAVMNYFTNRMSIIKYDSSSYSIYAEYIDDSINSSYQYLDIEFNYPINSKNINILWIDELLKLEYEDIRNINNKDVLKLKK